MLLITLFLNTIMQSLYHCYPAPLLYPLPLLSTHPPLLTTHLPSTAIHHTFPPLLSTTPSLHCYPPHLPSTAHHAPPSPPSDACLRQLPCAAEHSPVGADEVRQSQPEEHPHHGPGPPGPDLRLPHHGGWVAASNSLVHVSILC